MCKLFLLLFDLYIDGRSEGEDASERRHFEILLDNNLLRRLVVGAFHRLSNAADRNLSNDRRSERCGTATKKITPI
jgi:hypothetical protein